MWVWVPAALLPTGTGVQTLTPVKTPTHNIRMVGPGDHSGDRFDRARAAALTVHVWFLYSMDAGTAGTVIVRVMPKTSRVKSANDMVSYPAVAPVLRGRFPKRALDGWWPGGRMQTWIRDWQRHGGYRRETTASLF